MKLFLSSIFLSVLVLSTDASAQVPYISGHAQIYGTGMIAANGMCGYGARTSRQTRQKKDLQSEIDALEGQVEMAEKFIDQYASPGTANELKAFLKNKTCYCNCREGGDGADQCLESAKGKVGEAQANNLQKGKGGVLTSECGADISIYLTQRQAQIARACNPVVGACGTPALWKDPSLAANSQFKQLCDRAIGKYSENIASLETKKMEQELEDMRAEMDRNNPRQQGPSQRTEGTYCVDCERNPGPRLRDTIIAGVLDGVGMYANYRIQNNAIDRAAQLGWPYYPNPASGYGYPYAMASLYGATYGGYANGGFGCGPTIGGAGFPMGPYGMHGPFGAMNPYGGITAGGAFGMGPYGMGGGGPWGGGVFMPGMGPWGMGGPMGGFGMGGGFGIGGGFGGGMGGGFGVPGFGGGMFGPFGGMGGMGPWGMGGGQFGMGPWGMNGGAFGNPAMQYQQMMAQYQAYAQYQQQNQQRMQILSSLQQEYMRLQYQMQTVYQGIYQPNFQYGVGGNINFGGSIYGGPYGQSPYGAGLPPGAYPATGTPSYNPQYPYNGQNPSYYPTYGR